MAQLEKEYYPVVEKWMKKHFGCFSTAVNQGLMSGRIDIAGVRDVGGDLSGDVEVVGIEVKRGKDPFLKMCGQALGYGVFSDLVYLADTKQDGFTSDEVHIARHVGVGLIQLSKSGCKEVLSSKQHTPITKLRRSLLERLQLGKCQWCESVFDIGKHRRNVVRAVNTSTNKLERAYNEDKGLMFWNSELGDRKRSNKSGSAARRNSELTFDRRYLCPECITNVVGELLEDE